MENVSKEGESHCFENVSRLCTSFGTRLVLPTLSTLMFLIGLLGNVLSLWVFIVKVPNKTSTHVYLTNLVMSNLLLCITLPFQAAYFAAGDGWQSSQLACRLAVSYVTPVLHANIYLGMFILTWIALSRVAVLIQHQHRGRPSQCTRVFPPAFFRKLREVRFAKAVCLTIWGIVTVAICPVMFYYSTKEAGAAEAERKEVCYNVAVEVGGETSQASSIAAIVLFYLCYLLVLSCYIAVVRHICRSQKSTAISGQSRTYSRVFRNIMIIQLVITVCLLPHHVFKAVFISLARSPEQPAPNGCHPLSQLVEVKNFLLCLAELRCCTDPVMYFLLDQTFHRSALDLLKSGAGSETIQISAGASSSQAAKGHQSCGKDD